MRTETSVRNQAQYSAARKNPPRNNHTYNNNRGPKNPNHGQGYKSGQSNQGAYANQQQFQGQQSYGTISHGSGYQQSYNATAYNNDGGNSSWTGNVNGYAAPHQVQYPNGYQTPAPVPAQPLVQGYPGPQYPVPNMSYNQNYVPQQAPAPQIIEQHYAQQFPSQPQQQPLMQNQMQVPLQQNGFPHG